MDELHKCPLCGKSMVEEFDVCEICGWGSDNIQDRDHKYWGGFNDPSLEESREIWELVQSYPESIKHSILTDLYDGNLFNNKPKYCDKENITSTQYKWKKIETGYLLVNKDGSNIV